MKALSTPTLLLFCLLVVPAVRAQEEPAEKPAKTVDLAESFRIRQQEGEGISHTPAVIFTRDGKRMLTVTSDGKVVVFDVATRRQLEERSLPEPATDAVVVDPTGRCVAWARPEKGVTVLEIESGKIVARDPELVAARLAISPDGKRLAVATGPSIRIHELSTLEPTGDPIAASGAITNLAFSPDGELLAFTTQTGQVVVREPVEGRTVQHLEKKVPMYALAFSPDGKRLAYGGQDNTIWQLTLATKEETAISKGQPFWITCLGYSPDGKFIAAGDESCDIWLYEVASPKMLFHNKHHVECWLNSVAFAPDGETFLFGCRPNSLAGKPALYTPLARAEATRSAAVRESRARLLAALDGRIEAEKDESRRAELVTFRDRIAEEERAALAMGGVSAMSLETLESEDGGSGEGMPVGPPGSGSIGVGGGGGSGGAFYGGTTITPAAAAPPPDLPEDLQKLVEEHAKTIKEETKKLGKDFCVNQWKVR